MLGHRLEKIKFAYEPDFIDVGEWTAAWHLCSNLKEIISDELLVGQISTIMATPKYSL